MSGVEWKGRAVFAEVAETIGVPTDHIVGTHQALIVTYTAGVEHDEDELLQAVLARNPASGVLEVMSRRTIGTLGDFKDELRQQIDDVLGGDDA